MSQSFNKIYEFGAFRLDSVERALWRGDELLVLPPKVFDTLLVLVEKEGRVAFLTSPGRATGKGLSYRAENNMATPS
jgi:hypothetical protein